MQFDFSNLISMVSETGLEPVYLLRVADFKSAASTISPLRPNRPTHSGLAIHFTYSMPRFKASLDVARFLQVRFFENDQSCCLNQQKWCKADAWNVIGSWNGWIVRLRRESLTLTQG